MARPLGETMARPLGETMARPSESRRACELAGFFVGREPPMREQRCWTECGWTFAFFTFPPVHHRCFESILGACCSTQGMRA